MKHKARIKRLEQRRSGWIKTIEWLTRVGHLNEESARKAFKCPGSKNK